MAALNVEVILKLVDQLSGPARNAAKSLKEMVSAVKQLQGAGHGAQSLAKNLSAAARVMPGMSSEMRNIQASMRGMSSGAKVFGNSIAASSRAADRSFAGIPHSVISATREMARGLQYAQNMREKAAAEEKKGFLSSTKEMARGLQYAQSIKEKAAAEEKKGFLSSTKEMVRGLNNTSRIKDRAEAEDKRRRERTEAEEKRSAAATAREKERSLNQASRTLERFEAKEKSGRERAAAEEMRSMFSAGRVLSRGMMNSQSMRDRYETSSGRGGRRRGGGGGGGYYSPGFYGGYGHPHLRHGMHEMSDATGNLDTEEALLSLRGYSDADKLKISKIAGDIQTQVPQFTKARSLHSLQEAAFAGAGVDFLEDHAVKLAQGDVAVNSSMGEEKAKAFHSQMMEMIKSPEMKGRIKDKGFVDRWIDMSVKQAIASGGMVTPEKTYQSLKYFRTGLHGVNEEFLEKYLPQLNQEMMKGKGGGAGGAAGNPLESWIRGGTYMHPETRKNWEQANLMGPDGKPVENELRLQNPKKWTDRHFIPLLQDEGIDPFNEEHGAKVVSRMGDFFGNRVAQQVAQILVMQSKQFDERAPLITGTKGAKESYQTLSKTWEQTLKGLNEQTKNFGAEAFIPFAKAMIPIVRGATELEQVAAKFAEDHRDAIQKVAVPTLMAAGAIGGTALVAGLRTQIGRSVAGAVAGYMIDGGVGALIGANLLKGAAVRGAVAKAAIAGAEGAVAGSLLTRLMSSFGKNLGGKSGLFGSLAIASLLAMKSDQKNGNPLQHALREMFSIDDPTAESDKKAQTDKEAKANAAYTKRMARFRSGENIPLPGSDPRKKIPDAEPWVNGKYGSAMAPVGYKRWPEAWRKDVGDRTKEVNSWFTPEMQLQNAGSDRDRLIRNAGNRPGENTPGVHLLDQPWPPNGTGGAVPFTPPTDMSAQGGQAGGSWSQGFLGAVQGTSAAFDGVKSAANLDLRGQGTAAGTGWASAFLAAAKAISGATIQGPKVTPGTPSGPGSSGGGSEGKKESRVITHQTKVTLSDGFAVYGA